MMSIRIHEALSRSAYAWVEIIEPVEGVEYRCACAYLLDQYDAMVVYKSSNLHKPPSPCLYPLLESNGKPRANALCLLHKSLRQRDLKHLLVDSGHDWGLRRTGEHILYPTNIGPNLLVKVLHAF